jgi:putative flavoprotein involved in K+ transport
MTAMELERVRSVSERFDVIVIGGGQAGLSAGYHLARRGLSFVILDAQARIGDSWRRRWDSLKLFTPAQFDSLDGMRFPARSGTFPTKDQMADYLADYARHFRLPVRNGVTVSGVSRAAGRYLVQAGDALFEADHVVVAMANYQQPSVPDFARELDSAIIQMHAGAYRNPAQLRDGAVLVVGAGNSGAEIALELSKTRKVFLAGQEVGEIPFRMTSFLGRHVFSRLVLRLGFHRLLTLDTPVGRKMHAAQGPAPLIRTRYSDLAAAKVERMQRVLGVEAGRPVLEDGRVLEVANVVWCTGFEPDFSWIDLPVFDGEGRPLHQRGVAAGEPGLYFLGLNFLYAMSSTMIHGVGRDARHVVDVIARRSAAAYGRGFSLSLS